ncbi:MAG: hypothetical protein HQ519_16050 [Planctomycetes bacterium]|nr:hypothetical protein [Planctomycetota bacterium]
MKSKPFIILILLAVVVSVVVFWSDPNQEPVVHESDSIAAGADVLKPAEIDPEDGVQEETPKPERTTADEDINNVITVTDSHLLSIRLVYAKNDEPAIQVQGYWMALEESQNVDTFMDWTSKGINGEELLRAKGQAFTTDLKGLAKVRVPNQPIAIFARDGSRYADDVLPAFPVDTKATLALEQIVTVKVFVHDETGKALADFPMVLLESDEDWTSEMQSDHSDQGGIASFHHVSTRTPDADNLQQLIVRSAAPFIDAQKLILDPSSLSEEPLDYTVGPYGSLTIKLLDVDGSLHRPDTRCLIQTKADQPDFWSKIEGLTPQPEFGTGHGTAHDGVALFPYVGIGLELDVAAWMDKSRRPYQTQVVGPSKAQQNVEATIWMKELRPLLKFRLLIPPNEPIANEKFMTKIYVDGHSFGIETFAEIETDDEGRVEYIVTHLIDGKVPGSMTMEFIYSKEGLEYNKRFEVPPDLQPGEQDLGDIYLAEEPILLAGRVLDEHGKGQPGATLYTTPVPSDGLFPSIGGRLPRTKNDGSFEIRGATEAAQIRLHVSHRSGLNKEILTTPGTLDLVVQFDPSYRISGKVITDEDIPANMLVAKIGVQSEGGKVTRSWTWPSKYCDDDGNFEVLTPNALPATVYITDQESGAVVATIEQVRAVGHGEVGDPRLAVIDLRGKLGRYYLKFLNHKKLPMSQVEVTFPDMAMPGELDLAQGSFWDGKGVFILPLQPFQFTAVGMGHRKFHGQVESPGESVFQLKKGLAAQVRIVPASLLAENGRTILQLSPSSETATEFDLWDVSPDDQGVFHIHFPSPGTYTAQVDISRILSGGSERSSSFPKDKDAPKFEVLDSGGEQIFELRLDAATVEEYFAEDN